MNNELVSIIIPVYNAKEYLCRCLNSLVNQTYKNLEILLIDDGSKDNSLAICHDWQTKDSRVRVFHHENHGVSYTRNIGLANFKGNYVTFVDADDWAEPDYIEELLARLIENNVPISMCGYELNKDDGSSERSCYFQDAVISYTEALNPYSPYFSGSVWGYMYTREVLQDPVLGNIEFDLDIKIAEDRLFWFKVALRGKKVAVSSQPLYHYFINNNGAMKTKRFQTVYTDYLARRRIVELVKHDGALCEVNTTECILSARECLWYSDAPDHDERVREIKEYIRKNRGLYLRSTNVSQKEKIKMILDYFKWTRKLYRWIWTIRK